MSFRLLLLELPKNLTRNATAFRIGCRSYYTSQMSASTVEEAKTTSTVELEVEANKTVKKKTTKKTKAPTVDLEAEAKQNPEIVTVVGESLESKTKKKSKKTVKSEDEKTETSTVTKKKQRISITGSVNATMVVPEKKRTEKEKPPDPIDPTTLPGFSDEHCVMAIDPGVSNFGFALLTSSGHLLRWENIALFNKNTTFDASCYADVLVNFIHGTFEKCTSDGAPKSLSIVIEKQHLARSHYGLFKVRAVEAILWGVLKTLNEMDCFRTRWNRNVAMGPICPKDVAARFEISKKSIEQKVTKGTIVYTPVIKPVTKELKSLPVYALKKRAAVHIVTNLVTGKPIEFRPPTEGDASIQKIFCSPDQLHSFWSSLKKDDWADVILMAVRRMELDLNMKNQVKNIHRTEESTPQEPQAPLQ